MAYVKTNWQTGDKINADKLNKIEEMLERLYYVERKKRLGGLST